MSTRVELLRREIAVNQRRDYLQCKNSPKTFIRRHCTITTPDGTPIPFDLWEAQEEALKLLEQQQLVIVLKARRLGLSWLSLSYALWLAIFKPGVRIIMICKNLDDAQDMVERVRGMFNRMLEAPASRHLIQDMPKLKDSTRQLQIGESLFKALPATPRAARSETAGLLIWDEGAFAAYADQIVTGALPTIEGGGQVIFVSTGNGKLGDGKEFHQQWTRAMQGQSDWACLFIPWQARPGRDESWKQKQIRTLGSADRFRSEYPETPDDAFVVSGTDYVYSSTAIAAAVRLGEEFKTEPMLRSRGQICGIDWGENTHALLAYDLEHGGIYITDEIVESGTDPAQTAKTILAASSQLSEVAYDAAGIQSHRTFMALAPKNVSVIKVPFNKYKTDSIAYIRDLFERTERGETIGVIAIDPACTVLLQQLQELKFQDVDSGKVAKGNDHGADALITIAARIVEARRPELKELLEKETY